MAYYFVFNKEFELQKDPGIVMRNNQAAQLNIKDIKSVNWQEIFSVLSADKYYKIKGLDIFAQERGADEYESIVMPMSIQDKYLYYFVFNLSVPSMNYWVAHRQFFITVSNQIEVALNKIFAADAAWTIMSNIPSSIAVFDLETFRISFFNESFIKEIKLVPEKDYRLRYPGCNRG